MTTDRRFLSWLHERLEHVHGETPLVDYMHKLRAIIRSTPEDKETPNVGTFNSLEEMLEKFKDNPTSFDATRVMKSNLHIWDVVEHRRTNRIGRVNAFAHNGTTDVFVDGTGPYPQADFIKLVPESIDTLQPAYTVDAHDGQPTRKVFVKPDIPQNNVVTIGKSTTKGMMIRGAFAMAPVNEIYFKPRKGKESSDGLGSTDELKIPWDLLPPGTQEGWARLAEILETAIKSYKRIAVGQEPNEDSNEHMGIDHNTPSGVPTFTIPQNNFHAVVSTNGVIEDPTPWYKNTEQLNIENLGPCPFEDKLCPECKQELKPTPSGWSCTNGHGY